MNYDDIKSIIIKHCTVRDIINLKRLSKSFYQYVDIHKTLYDFTECHPNNLIYADLYFHYGNQHTKNFNISTNEHIIYHDYPTTIYGCCRVVIISIDDKFNYKLYEFKNYITAINPGSIYCLYNSNQYSNLAELQLIDGYKEPTIIGDIHRYILSISYNINQQLPFGIIYQEVSFSKH